MNRFKIIKTGLPVNPTSIRLYDSKYRQTVRFQLTTSLAEYKELYADYWEHETKLNGYQWLEEKERLPLKGQAREFIKYLTFLIGDGFHPDTPMAEYVHVTSGKPSFVPAQAEILQKHLDRCFELLGENGIYEVLTPHTEEIGE